MARVYLKGLPQLKAKLVKLQNETATRVRPAMEAAATEITEMMKRLVPSEHGALRQSIGWTWGDAPTGSISVSHTIAGNRITISAGSAEAFYARWVEFGTAPHSLAKGARRKAGKLQDVGPHHPGATAQPFFYPSYRALRKHAKLTIAKAIRQAVKEIASS